MLAGAYRKEMVYQNQIDANLIPFPYHRLTLTSDLKENSKFLETLGYVVYNNQLAKIQIIEPNSKHNSLIIVQSVINSIKKLVKKRKQIRQAKQVDHFKRSNQLLLNLSTLDNKKKRQKVIALCSKMNKRLCQYAKKSSLKPHNYVVTLSKKVDSKHYQKTLKNLRNNIKQLNKICRESKSRNNIILELKVFNKEISKYC